MRPFGSRRRAVLLCLPILLLLPAAPPAAAAISPCVSEATQLAGGDVSVSQDCRYTPGLSSFTGVLGLPGGPPALIKDIGTETSAEAASGKALARLQCYPGSPVSRRALHCLVHDNGTSYMHGVAPHQSSNSYIMIPCVPCRHSCIHQLYLCGAGWL